MSQHYFTYIKNSFSTWRMASLNRYSMSREDVKGGHYPRQWEYNHKSTWSWPQGWEISWRVSITKCIPCMRYWSRHITDMASQTNPARQILSLYRWVNWGSEKVVSPKSPNLQGKLTGIPRLLAAGSQIYPLSINSTLLDMQHLCVLIISLPSFPCYLCTADLATAQYGLK